MPYFHRANPKPNMPFSVKPFAELTTAELHAIYTARVAVFVVEQACPYQEVDAHDLAALHIFAEQHDKIITYCRLIPHGDSVHLGRVLVLPLRWITPAPIFRKPAFTPKRKPICKTSTHRSVLPPNPSPIWKTISRILICYCPPRNHSDEAKIAVKLHAFRLPYAMFQAA